MSLAGLRFTGLSASSTRWGSLTGVPLFLARRFASAESAAVVNYYRRLGVAITATPQEVKAAYRKRALQCHPDVASADGKARAEVEFRSISEAYDALSDPRLRRMHDDTLGVTAERRAHERKQKAAAEARAKVEEEAEESATAQSQAESRSGAHTAQAASAFTQHGRRSRAKSARSSFSATKGNGNTGAKTDRKKRPFLRGDADRMFQEAFEGKTLDQVLFDERWKRIRDAKARAAKTSVAEHKERKHQNQGEAEEDKDAWQADGPAGREETLRRVIFDATEQFAANVQRQYGPSALKNVKFSTRRPIFPKKPPSSHMPFRPFHGAQVPEGITTPPDPVLGPTTNVTEEPVEAFVDKPLRWLSKGLPQETPDGRKWFERTKYVEKERNMAHNMGKLYSYQRPF